MIKIENFTKQFGTYKAIKNLSFEVKEGEIFAFLGANGSGKTTTIRCLLDIYQPTSGTLLVNGQPYIREMSDKIGYLPEERGLYISGRVGEVLIYFARLKGLSVKQAQARVEQYLEQVQLIDAYDATIKTLSSGQQQKIQLALATINHPELLILDEPTKGLDPVNRSLLMNILRDLNQQGSTIIFITHQMDEVEKIADRLVMIKNGKRILYGEVAKVKQEFGEHSLQITYQGDFPVNKELYQISRRDKNYAELTLKPQTDPETVLEHLLSEPIKIHEFKVGFPSLEQIFINVTQ